MRYLVKARENLAENLIWFAQLMMVRSGKVPSPATNTCTIWSKLG